MNGYRPKECRVVTALYPLLTLIDNDLLSRMMLHLGKIGINVPRDDNTIGRIWCGRVNSTERESQRWQKCLCDIEPDIYLRKLPLALSRIEEEKERGKGRVIRKKESVSVEGWWGNTVRNRDMYEPQVPTPTPKLERFLVRNTFKEVSNIAPSK